MKVQIICSVLIILLSSKEISTMEKVNDFIYNSRSSRSSYIMKPPDLPKLDIEQSETIVDSGSSLTIICNGSRPVMWDFPNNTNDDGLYWSSLNIHIRNTPSDPIYPYGAKLEISNASFTDTGYYYCHFNDTFDKDDINTFTSIYVYVRDEEQLLIPNPTFTIHSTQYRSVIIPCRPTSPDVTVKLLREDDEGADITHLYKYDRHYGFTIKNMSATDAFMYQCLAKRGKIEKRLSFLLMYFPYSDFIAKPRIEGIKKNYVVGEMLRITCSVQYNEPALIEINWKIPHPSDIETGRITVSGSYDKTRGTGHHRVAESELIIKEIEKKDQGTYKCIVNDHQNNVNSDEKNISTLNDGESFINVKETNNQTYLIVEAKRHVKWVVNIESYPKARVDWFNNENKDITGTYNTKYRIENNVNDNMWILEINNVQLQDAGVYYVNVSNEKIFRVLNLNLEVLDKPLVEFKTNQYYIKDTNVSVVCEIYANPKPSIYWVFKPCFGDACNTTYHINPNKYTIEQSDVYKYKFVSTYYFNVQQSGELTCKANNSRGHDSVQNGILVTDVKDGFQVWRENENEDPVAVGENITFICGASSYNHTNNLQWYHNNTRKIQNKYNTYIYASYTPFTFRSKLTLINVNHSDAGYYKCEENGFSDTATLKIEDAKKPQIKKKFNKPEVQLQEGEQLTLNCSVEGLPVPKITWKKDGQTWIPENRIVFSNNNQNVTFNSVLKKDEAEYTCIASNIVGYDRMITKVSVLYDAKPSHYILIGVLIAVFFVLIPCLVIKIRNERILKRERKEFMIAGLAHFEEGAIENLNPDLAVDDQAELLPYDKKWEFPREKLKLGKQLGAGAFGVVMKADAHGISEMEEVTTVAVKMVKRNADYTYIKALASELKIMVHLGKHLNVVNLLGACTKNVTKRELLVIVEYCRFGNLHNYLLRHRVGFVDQIDPKTGKIDLSIGEDILANSGSFDAQRTDSMKEPDSPIQVVACPGGADYRAAAAEKHNRQNSSGSDVCNNEEVLMTPGGDDAPILSNSSTQPEWRSNYKGDYKGNVQPICTQELLQWAFQVARGMEYLSSRKVLHGDLAARNILLADGNIVKICDFGLAKSMYKSDNYRKKGEGPLPVKWMAIESIQDRIFSSQSDVWAFGIVLWEFFSLAKTPYPGMEPDVSFFNKLKEGYRMDKPQYSTCDIYEIMRMCWEAEPKQRPTFTQLTEKLGQTLEDSVRLHYIDLNDPYQRMNAQSKADGQNDYLSMLSPPGSLEPSSSQQYINELNPQRETNPQKSPTEGYLCMKSPNSIFSPKKVDNATVFSFETQKKHTEPAEIIELTPMLNSRLDSESDTEVQNTNTEKSNVPKAFSNPSYRSSFPAIKVQDRKIMSNTDNYVNMPKNKSGLGNKMDNNLEHHYVNNTSRDWNAQCVN